VAPTGYKYYAIVKGKVSAAKPVTLENPAAPIEGKFYNLQLDAQSGAIAHLIDKTTGEDLVNASSGYGLNEYLYVTGGEEGNYHNRLLHADPTLPIPQLTINRPTMVGIPTVQSYPWGTVVTVHSRALNTPEIISTITLNDQQKMVSFDDEVEKTATLKKEGVYFAFPFAVQNPHVEYQGATAWVNPVSDMLPGANLQWFTTQGGVRVWGTNQSVDWVSVDTSLITLEDINRGLWPASIEIRNGTVFSYAMNNYWNETSPAQQGGHFNFRYALTSGRELSPSDSTYLSLEQRSPLLVLRHEHKEWKQTLPVEGAGFLSSSPAGVVVLTVRPGPSQDTYIVRVHNTTGQDVKASLQFPRIELADAYLGSVLGDRIGSVGWSGHEVNLPMARFDVKTVVVHVTPGQN